MRVPRVHCLRVSTVACLVLASVAAAGTTASAQERPDPSAVDLRTALANPVVVTTPQVLPPPAMREQGPKRPSALMPLYASFIGLQALDYHSTRRAMNSGTTSEGNPLMKPFVSNDAAFIAVKASATAGTIFVTEKLRKKHPKAAVVLAAAFNAGMALVVTHNYRVVR